MKTKKSLIMYFSVVALLVVMSYGLKTTFAHFIASEQGTATNIKIAKLTYKLESENLENNALNLKPYEIKKINVILSSDYDMSTVYRLNYIGNVNVYKSSNSVDDVKDLIEAKQSKNIDLVIANRSADEQTVIFNADGGYVGNELQDGNIFEVYDEDFLLNKLLVDGTLSVTERNEYRDLVGVNNYINLDDTIYRVLGVFKDENDYYLKVITEESIGKQVFGENNNYLTSILNTYLNVEFKDSLPDVLKNNISEVTYFTAGLDNVLDNITSLESEKLTYYDYERGDLIADDTFNVSGKSTVGLMYLSDYEYAKSWINKNYTELTLVPNNIDKEVVYCINYQEEIKTEKDEMGNEVEKVIPVNEISTCKTTEKFYVRPVMYLKNNIKIESGTGTLEDPYKIIESTE